MHACKKYRQIKHVQGYGGKGLSDNHIIFGGNSGYQAICLAYLFGAKKVLLLGYDMGITKGLTHWFGDHPKGLQVPSPYNTWIESYKTLAKDAEKAGLKIINCSRQTKLDCFERSTIDQCLK